MSRTYQVVEWLNEENCHWHMLSQNPHPGAIERLRENRNKIVWRLFATNTSPEAVELLEEYINNTLPTLPFDVMFWENICANPTAFHLFDKIPEFERKWFFLSKNPAAIDYLLKNPHNIDWVGFYTNPHPEAIRIIADKFSNTTPTEEEMSDLVRNPRFVSIFENPVELLNNMSVSWINFEMRWLSRHPEAFWWLLEHPEYIHWVHFAMNPLAIELLRVNQDKFNKSIWANPAIFERAMPAFKNAAEYDA